MPEVFNKLKEELKTIMPHAPHDVPTFSQLNNLPYLNAVVKEGQYRPPLPTTDVVPGAEPNFPFQLSESTVPLPRLWSESYHQAG